MINIFQMLRRRRIAIIEFHANFPKFSLQGDAMRYYNVTFRTFMDCTVGSHSKSMKKNMINLIWKLPNENWMKINVDVQQLQ